MNTHPVSREAIVNAIRNAVQPASYVDAMWEGVLLLFNPVDQWSDIDLYSAAQDGRVEDAVASVEKAVSKLATIVTRYILPQPTWAPSLAGFLPVGRRESLMLLDFVVMKRSATNKFLEPEIHGQALVYFDKTGFTKVAPIDGQAFNAKLKERLETLRVTFPLFQTLMLKEINRRNYVEALAFYQGLPSDRSSSYSESNTRHSTTTSTPDTCTMTFQPKCLVGWRDYSTWPILKNCRPNIKKQRNGFSTLLDPYDARASILGARSVPWVLGSGMEVPRQNQASI